MKNNKRLSLVGQIRLRWFLLILILVSMSGDTPPTFVEKLITSHSLPPTQLNAYLTTPTDKLIIKNPKLDSSLAELVSAYESSARSELGQDHFKLAPLSQDMIQVQIAGTTLEFKKVNELVKEAGGDPQNVAAIRTVDWPTPTQRPSYSALNCDKLRAAIF